MPPRKRRPIAAAAILAAIAAKACIAVSFAAAVIDSSSTSSSSPLPRNDLLDDGDGRALAKKKKKEEDSDHLLFGGACPSQFRLTKDGNDNDNDNDHDNDNGNGNDNGKRRLLSSSSLSDLEDRFLQHELSHQHQPSHQHQLIHPTRQLQAAPPENASAEGNRLESLSTMSSNYLKWSSANLLDYDFIYERKCFCTAQWSGPFIVRVRSSKVNEVEYANPDGGGGMDFNSNRIRLFRIPTVEGMFFDIVEAALQGKAAYQAVEDSLNVPYDRPPAFRAVIRYDAILGYPTRTEVDMEEDVADDETVHLISDVVPPGAGRPVTSGLILAGCYPSLSLGNLAGFVNTRQHEGWGWHDAQAECAQLCMEPPLLATLSWVMDYGDRNGDENAPNCRCAAGDGFVESSIKYANGCGTCDGGDLGRDSFFNDKACLMKHAGVLDYAPPPTPPPAAVMQSNNGDVGNGDAPAASPGTNSNGQPTFSQFANFSPSEIAAFQVFEAHRLEFDEQLFLYQTPAQSWIPSTIYKFEGFYDAIQVMVEDGVAGRKFYLGDGGDNGDDDVLYGLVNVAAFLAQSMKETIMYDACDENNWDVVNGKYPLSNACGQLQQDYGDYKCSAGQEHMACDVDKTMEMRAVTNSKWYGAPGPLFCGPKGGDYGDNTGYWDYQKRCDTCDDYEGQKGGGYENEIPWANRLGKSDVEGCCWWGRGVIQTTGVCNFGRLNYYLGARAHEEGRESRYPLVDFCKNPEAICSSTDHPELKWVAGFFYWVDQVQEYNSGGFKYKKKLKEFVDGGMTDHSFIGAISGIVNRGCHNPPCGTGAVDGGYERRNNFNKVLDVLLSDESLLSLNNVVTTTTATTTVTAATTTVTAATQTTGGGFQWSTTEATINNGGGLQWPPGTSPTPGSGGGGGFQWPPGTSPTPESGTPPTGSQSPGDNDASPDRQFYPNYADNTCYSDGKQPTWQTSTIPIKGSMYECCSSYFLTWQLEDCMAPLLADARAVKFYPDFYWRSCNNDGGQPEWMAGMYLQETKLYCCLTFFADDYEDCEKN